MLHIFVTNEPASLGGREWLGWPRMLADISFFTETTTMDGVITARLERPAGVELAVSRFVPAQRLDDLMLAAGGGDITMAATIQWVHDVVGPMCFGICCRPTASRLFGWNR